MKAGASPTGLHGLGRPGVGRAQGAPPRQTTRRQPCAGSSQAAVVAPQRAGRTSPTSWRRALPPRSIAAPPPAWGGKVTLGGAMLPVTRCARNSNHGVWATARAAPGLGEQRPQHDVGGKAPALHGPDALEMRSRLGPGIASVDAPLGGCGAARRHLPQWLRHVGRGGPPPVHCHGGGYEPDGAGSFT